MDPRALEQRILHQLQTANQWYTEDSMIVNPEKHHAMVLGTTDHKFSFPVEDSLDLLGMTIDNHVSLVCKKVNNHLVINHKRHLRNTRYANFNAICPKYKRETEGGRKFAVFASRLWNNVPLSARKVDSVACFKGIPG